MKISGMEKETYLYINGLGVCRPIYLTKDVEFLPAHCSPSPDDIISTARSELDLGVMAIFLREIQSQLRITAKSNKEVAILAWNSLWDGLLLGALHDCEAVCNFQCNKPAEEFNSETKIEITNYHLRGLTNTPHIIEEDEALWIESNFEKARHLLDYPQFSTAIHCLATYRWHPHPRIGLALLWFGIESLFKIESEISFRISQYVSRFLSPADKKEMKKIFKNTRKLYNQRSKAVHGSKIRGDPQKDIQDSAKLLQKLVRLCITSNGLPNIDELAP